MPALPVRHLVLYAALAAAAWAPASLHLARHPAVGLRVGLGWLALKATIWIAPALVLVARVLGQPIARTLRLGPPADVRGLAWSALASAVWLVVLTLAFGAPSGPALGATALVLTTANAIVEEIPFRGFLLGQLEGRLGFWRANLAQAALFVAVHVPAWLAQGLRFEILPSSLVLGTLALVLGWVTRRSGTIWIAVVLHAANNVIAG